MENKAEGPPSCSCGRDVVKYQCINESCPNIETQKFYCIKCLQDFKNHSHKADEIEDIKYLKEIELKWKNLNDQYTQMFP